MVKITGTKCSALLAVRNICIYLNILLCWLELLFKVHMKSKGTFFGF